MLKNKALIKKNKGFWGPPFFKKGGVPARPVEKSRLAARQAGGV
ncbi:hypothetical protein ACU81Q_04740 [Komagataeibacter melomenusus]